MTAKIVILKAKTMTFRVTLLLFSRPYQATVGKHDQIACKLLQTVYLVSRISCQQNIRLTSGNVRPNILLAEYSANFSWVFQCRCLLVIRPSSRIFTLSQLLISALGCTEEHFVKDNGSLKIMTCR